MSLPRLLLIVALGGLLGAVLLWGALALVYGPEVAFVLRVLFSSAVAGVVRVYVADQNGDEVDIIPDVGPVGAEVVALGAADSEAAAKVEGAAARAAGVPFHDNPYRKGPPSSRDWLYSAWEHGWTSGAPVELRERVTIEVYQPLVDEAAARFAPGLPAPRLTFDAVDWWLAAPGPSGLLAGLLYPRRKRPGQWGWRARMLRARRLDRAEQRREREWSVRARGRQQAVLGGRKGRRAIDRWLCLEGQARGLGIEPLPGEFTTALRDRVLRARIIATTPPGPTRADLAALTGGVVEVDNTTATVRITMPAGTSVERCEEVRADIAERMPPYVAVEVVCAAS